MAAAYDRGITAKPEHGHETGDEQIGRNRKQPSGIEGAAKIDEREKEKNAQAKRQRLCMQGRHR